MLSRANSRDTCYHLLRLASRPWHSLERTLDPRSIQCGHQWYSYKTDSSDSNWSSAWHLWRVLISIGFSSLNPIATSRLHLELASHLETVGLWEWAVFALMHEADPMARAAAVKRLLTRHISLRRPLRTAENEWRLDMESISQFSQAETFIIERFGVPSKWFHEAKV